MYTTAPYLSLQLLYVFGLDLQDLTAVHLLIGLNISLLHIADIGRGSGRVSIDCRHDLFEFRYRTGQLWWKGGVMSVVQKVLGQDVVPVKACDRESAGQLRYE